MKNKKTKTILRKILDFKEVILKSKKGSAIAISLTATGFIVLAGLGASSVIISSFKGSTNVERNNNAFLVAESAVEIALFEVSEHSSGFEVSHNFEEDDHSHVNLIKETKSEGWWEATSRDSMEKSASANTLVLPTQEDPVDVNTWDNWNEADLGTTKVIKLYSDNTSCAAENGKPCDYVTP